VGVKAFADLKGALVELKGRFSAVMPEQGNGRGGCGSANGEKDVVQQPGLSEPIAELARAAAKPANLWRPAVEPEHSAGTVEEATWYFWLSSTVCAPVMEASAMAPSGTAQGMTGQKPRGAGESLCFHLHCWWCWRALTAAINIF
jgi:hypothetical protein